MINTEEKLTTVLTRSILSKSLDLLTICLLNYAASWEDQGRVVKNMAEGRGKP
jgi:hypothetical protein